jgi:hypothetical protein
MPPHKIYYVLKSRAACLGAPSTCERLPELFTNKEAAEAYRKSQPPDKYTIYLLGDMWKSELPAWKLQGLKGRKDHEA